MITEEEEETLWAIVTHIQGDVKILRNGEEIAASPLILQADDEIRTGDDGEIEIHLLDGSIICVSPNCCFVFREIKEDLLKGETFWGRIRSLIHRKSWQIDTPSAASAVRGTEFILEVAEDGTTTLTVLKGTVEFSDRALTESVLVRRNQTSVTKPWGTPSSPASIDPVEIDRWWEWAIPEASLLYIVSLILLPALLRRNRWLKK